MFTEKFNNVDEIFLKMTGTTEALPVVEGILWCVAGIFLRNIFEANKRKVSVIKLFKEQNFTDIVIKILVVLISMRFFRFIFDTDAIALAGLFIGLSLDYLPRVIVYLPKVILERFDFSGFLRKQSDKDIKSEFPEEDKPYWDRYDRPYHSEHCEESLEQENREENLSYKQTTEKDNKVTPTQEASKKLNPFLKK